MMGADEGIKIYYYPDVIIRLILALLSGINFINLNTAQASLQRKLKK